MRYADQFCSYEEEYTPEHQYVYTGCCIATGKRYTVTVPGTELWAYRQGSYIQDAMPSVPPPDREFLINGVSPDGWKEWYGELE